MLIINGTEIAKEILERLEKQPKPEKFLAAVLVGDDPASTSFIRQKEKIGKQLGIDFRLRQFSAELTQDELRGEVEKIVSDPACGGVIIQLPLPKHIDRHYILNAVPKEKDIDVLGDQAAKAFSADINPIHPPAVAVVEEIAHRLTIDIKEKKVAIIGTGLLVGKPIGEYFQNKASSVSIFHRSSGDVRTQLGDFDLVISGAGAARLFSVGDLSPRAVVVDFGYAEMEGRMVGDFNPAGAEASEVSYTPTPGGTGPILVAKLYENFYALQKGA